MMMMMMMISTWTLSRDVSGTDFSLRKDFSSKIMTMDNVKRTNHSMVIRLCCCCYYYYYYYYYYYVRLENRD
jgi:Ca2+/Na+ antiporter